MEQTIITILSLLLVAQFIDNLILRQKIYKTNKDLLTAKKSEEKVYAISVGDKVTFNYDLTIKSTKEDFSVIYEADVVEISDKSIKVIAYDFQMVSGHLPTIYNNNKSHFILFMKEKWVDRESINKIRSKNDERDHKIDQVLN